MATLLTKERQTRRTTGAAPVEPGPERRGWIGLTIALVAVIAVAVTLFVVFSGGDADVADASPAESEAEALERLVNEGYIPKEALGGSAEANPSGADDPAGAPQDTATTPAPTEQELTDRFQNEGLIPR